MTEFGKTLRDAREQKGITIAQIAEQTHLLPQIVEDLEHEDFHRISAPIYGRGFVKLYCEAVGLEPKPLVDEFMAILNGEREPAIRLKEVALPPEEPVPAEPEPPKPPTYIQAELDGSIGGDEDARQETGDAGGEGASQETRDTGGEGARLQASDARFALPPEPRQYHPAYARATPSINLPFNLGRVAILVGCAIVLITLLILGIRALYRASMGVTDDAEAAPAAAEETAVTPAEKASSAKNAAASAPRAAGGKPATARTPKAVPPLYID